MVAIDVLPCSYRAIRLIKFTLDRKTNNPDNCFLQDRTESLNGINLIVAKLPQLRAAVL